MSDPERLPEDLRDLLDAERELDAPLPATRARMLARLAPLVIPAAIGAGAAAGGAMHAVSVEAASGAEVVGTAAAGLKVKAVVALIAATLGAVGGAATHAALAPASASVGAQAAPPPRVTLEKREPVAPPSAVAPATPTQAAVPRALPDAPEASSSAGKKPVKAPSLRDERLLLERATSALVRGDATSALASLREHARRFPRGELAEEREVLLVRALRAAGQEAAAK